MENYIIIAIITVIIGLAAWYIIRAKKSGKKCIGCPDGCSASKGKTCDGACCCCGGAPTPDSQPKAKG